MTILEEVTTLPSTGVLLGNRGYQHLADNIKISMGNTNYFGSVNDRYYEHHQNFINRFIEPIRLSSMQMENIQAVISNENVIVPIVNEVSLRSIPPIMMPYVLTHQPMFDLLQQGRISGWGYEAEELEHTKEVHDRLLITNGTIHSDTYETVEEDGVEYTEFTWEFVSGDPDLSLEDMEYIDQTREYISELLKNSILDPTDMDDIRG